ncbi:hypothetical protein DEA06_06755 [Microbacterium sp. Gd 4-13]|nr:hypothetical protein DEA06_06755 [Microbacterium sp. Gd 4-13]
MRVVLAFQALLKDLGAEALEITDVKPGSILLTIKQWSRSFAQKRKVRVLATQLLQVAESMTVEKAQAENTALHSKSVAGMADSTKHLKSFSFDSGPLQYVQYEDENGDQHGRARVLNSKEIASNRLGDDLLSDPSRMFKQLEGKPGTMDAISD